MPARPRRRLLSLLRRRPAPVRADVASHEVLSEMRVALAEILRRRVLSPAPGARAERVARRNVTFSPAGGTRVVALTRMPDSAPAARSGLSGARY